MSCLLCPSEFPTHDQTLVCSKDFYAVARLLDPHHVGDRQRPEFDAPSIPRLHALLDPTKKRATDTGGGRPPGFASQVPIDVHAVSLADPRSQANGRAWTDRQGRWHWEQGPGEAPISVAGALESWATLLCETRGLSGPDRHDPYPRASDYIGPMTLAETEASQWCPPRPGVTELAGFLHRHLEWIAAQEWVVDMAGELYALSAQLRTAVKGVTGERRPRPIPGARCSTVVDRDEHGQPVLCGGVMFPRWSDDDQVRVLACAGECRVRVDLTELEWPLDVAAAS